MKTIPYGFCKGSIDETDYVFGVATKLADEILQPDGQWDAFLPEYEPQFEEGWDSHGCCLWGTQNAIEMIHYRKFNSLPNYCERYNYILVPIRPPGSTPNAVAENIRRDGLIVTNKLPITKTFEEFITPDPMPKEFINLGKKFLAEYSFFHEWVWRGSPTHEAKTTLIREALRFSPIGVSVTAWYPQDAHYVSLGKPNNHWCVCYGYIEEEGKTYFKIFDSYDHSTKLLHHDHHIEVAKRYSLTKGITPQKHTSVVDIFLNLIRSLMVRFK